MSYAYVPPNTIKWRKESSSSWTRSTRIDPVEADRLMRERLEEMTKEAGSNVLTTRKGRDGSWWTSFRAG